MKQADRGIFIRLYFSLIMFLIFPLSVVVSLIYSLDNMYIGHIVYSALKIFSFFAVILLIIFIVVLIVKYIKNKK